ncbi:MAG TPA: xanthine dehydrogenase family protein subunit M [Pseudolabrys sp.]|nr:xanthine dehydrogenase family protein subunit M [Pseudolabrys sp.]
MKAPRFEYVRPTRLEDAIGALAKHGSDAKAIAGGQSLVPMLAFRLAAPRLLVDIGRIPGLNQITVGGDGIALGALVRWRDIERSDELRRAHPLLVEAVRHVAHYQIRNRGTVGGSLAHADPAAEMPGIAVTCDAQIVVAGVRGRRTIPAAEFFVAALSTALEPDELIVEVRLPPWPQGRRWAFEEFARRRGDFALAGVALFYDVGADGRAANAHVGAIGVGDVPLRLAAAEAVLERKLLTEPLIREAGAAAAASVNPADDIHAPGEYRRALLGVLTERALARAAGLPLRESA